MSARSTQIGWTKLGRIYCPSGALPWARTHAANPVPEHIIGDRYRIYFSARDDQNRSSIGAIEIDLRTPHTILDEMQQPILAPGELAMFDDSGASVGCIVPVGNARYLYYMGWNLTVTVPWKNAIGLAISDGPGQPFRRYSRFPIIGLDETDPYTISYPWVMLDGGLYRMWYGSNLKWGPVKRDMLHVIKYAESRDGIHWERSGQVVIDAQSPDEYAICKPCVVKEADGTYSMWYSSRGDKYRIYYASSRDGITWTQHGRDFGIDVSPDGWDSEMIEYASVFDHNGRRYMLYAGNDFARTGFGLAVGNTPKP